MDVLRRFGRLVGVLLGYVWMIVFSVVVIAVIVAALGALGSDDGYDGDEGYCDHHPSSCRESEPYYPEADAESDFVPPESWEYDMDCVDYPNQSMAQYFYNVLFQKYGYDVHRLDEDRDGIACELLP